MRKMYGPADLDRPNALLTREPLRPDKPEVEQVLYVFTADELTEMLFESLNHFPPLLPEDMKRSWIDNFLAWTHARASE